MKATIIVVILNIKVFVEVFIMFFEIVNNLNQLKEDIYGKQL